MARMVKIIRIIRMVRFLTQIRIMVAMIVGSLMNLFWLAIILVCVMYVFAIILTQGATMWSKPDVGTPPLDHEDYEKVRVFYGSLYGTIYTLFAAMTSGVSWMECANVAQAFG